MKVVIPWVSPEEIEERRRKGIDRFDEVWEGVYHMVPPPTSEHQGIVTRLAALLEPYTSGHGLGELRIQLGVADPLDPGRNFRVPDLLFLRRGREQALDPKSWWVASPDVVIEVRSPEDETYEKLPFYAARQVGEVFVIDSQTRKVEMFRLAGPTLVGVSPDAAGWVRSEPMRCAFRSEKSRLILHLDMAGSESII